MKRLLLLFAFALVFRSLSFAQSPAAQPLDPSLLNELDISFRPSVFTGSKFPDFDFVQPKVAHEILGRCKRSAVFYDADFRQVEFPITSGRYGAIITITPDIAPPFKRYLTLFHEPGRLIWRNKNLHLSMRFPEGAGLPPDLVDHQTLLVNNYITRLWGDSFSRDSSSASFLAGLYETRDITTPLLLRDSPDERESTWWYRLKQKTGDYVPLKYLTYLPRTYGANSDKWPLVLFLHGSGERGDDLDQVKAWGIARMGAMGKDMPFIAICPQCPARQRWLATELNDFLTKEILPKHRVDESRIYVTGLSMGGFATWSLIQQFPTRFAAAIPICGVGDPRDIAQIKSLPIWIFHGGADDTVPVESSREMNAALKAINGNVQYTEFPGVGHVSWEKAYATPELFPWLLAQRRSETP